MSDQDKPVRRGSRTSIDMTIQRRKATLIGSVAGVVVLLLVLILLIKFVPSVNLAAGNLLNFNSHKDDELIPRNIDMWAVYPTGEVRFSTLFHPQVSSVTEQSVLMEVAGPLMYKGNDVIKSEVIGGDVIGINLNTGPGQGSEFVYELYQLAYLADGEPYGVDLRVTQAPYLTWNPDTDIWTVTFGITPQQMAGYYQQIIVAVAIPRQAEIIGIPELQPYRIKNVGDWRVHYYDTTTFTIPADPAEPRSIRIEFKVPVELEVEDYDYFAVNAAR